MGLPTAVLKAGSLDWNRGFHDVGVGSTLALVAPLFQKPRLRRGFWKSGTTSASVSPTQTLYVDYVPGDFSLSLPPA